MLLMVHLTDELSSPNRSLFIKIITLFCELKGALFDISLDTHHDK